jgi:hypothetical protein
MELAARFGLLVLGLGFASSAERRWGAEETAVQRALSAAASRAARAPAAHPRNGTLIYGRVPGKSDVQQVDAVPREWGDRPLDDAATVDDPPFLVLTASPN